jgi:hypothetical protein
VLAERSSRLVMVVEGGATLGSSAMEEQRILFSYVTGGNGGTGVAQWRVKWC